MPNKVLVCGGAGYIGSHTTLALLEKGYNVIVADNLETGYRDAVSEGAALFEGDLRDYNFIEKLLKDERPDAVIDFAAYSLVGVSYADPLKYYENNVCGTRNLLEAMKKNEIGHIVFSSTAAVYGNPKSIPIKETDETTPINPYGETKLAIEKMLKWVDAANGIKYTALRYFNASGAHPSGKIGENHKPETHLIPNLLKAALTGEEMTLYGTDYNTPDGTCIRDYVHVCDLADAHILALENLFKTGTSATYNLGNTGGFSNRQILNTAEIVSGVKIRYKEAERRPGDPDILIASSDKIRQELGWEPRFNSLEEIIKTAFLWHKNNPFGYSR